ncbi:hypothetical protein D9757_010263 [Collybiopsis confluens]|uniref:Uncharacterized protein n=1 Tax=Collybiopsis confluens TaxID=2823264 RepID=A0A8H5HAY9_9AGAR|nr:hypothetical protein D9757_010263 [Collybiopsis confluens]
MLSSLLMLHPYLGNEAGCLHESSIRSPATTLPVNVVIPPPCSIYMLGAELAVHAVSTVLENPNFPLSHEPPHCPESSICSAAAALTVNVAIPFHTPPISWEPSWLSTRFLHLFLLSGSPSN